MVPEKRNIDTKQTAKILKYTYYFESVRKTLSSGNSSPGRIEHAHIWVPRLLKIEKSNSLIHFNENIFKMLLQAYHK